MKKLFTLTSILAGAFLFAPSAKAQFSTAFKIDCSMYPGAPDMGVQINNCLAAAPATRAIYDTTRFTSPQMILTPVVMNKPGVIVSCAITIFQSAGISIKMNNAAWTGCPDKSTVLVKSADLDQFTVTSAYNEISNLDLEGGKSKFSGNGIVLDNTAGQQQQAKISNNMINAQLNDGILNIAGSYNQIEENNIQDYGAHAVELNGAFLVRINANVISGLGDETSSTIFAHGNCLASISDNNLIENRAGFPAIDGRGCGNLKITSNSFIASTTGIAVEVYGGSEISANYIGGVTALEVVGGGGTAQNNVLRSIGGHTVVLDGANQFILSGNDLTLVDAVGGLCGINITGDTLGVQAIGNSVTLTSTGGDDYGACLTLTSGHMLNNLIDGLSVTGFSHGDYSFFFNNAAGQNTNVLNTIRNVSCIHVAACYKRVDPAENVTLYEDAFLGDAPLDAGTGSSQDIFIQPKLPFANLPSPAGDGSHTFCQDCTAGSVVTGDGAGSMVFRVAGVWKGM